MTSINSLLLEVINYIKNESGLENVSYTTAFTADRLPNPLTKPRIAVGLEEAKLKAGAMGQVLSGDGYGNRVEAALKIKIYMPESDGGAALSDMFFKICTVLLTSGSALGITALSCGEICYETAAMAYTISCRADLVTYIEKYENDDPIIDIVVR